jgi:hypothetical protein
LVQVEVPITNSGLVLVAKGEANVAVPPATETAIVPHVALVAPTAVVGQVALVTVPMVTPIAEPLTP